jgi:hypothetical protein
MIKGTLRWLILQVTLDRTLVCDTSTVTKDGQTLLTILIRNDNVDGLKALIRSNQPMGPFSVGHWVLPPFKKGRVRVSPEMITTLHDYLQVQMSENKDIRDHDANHHKEFYLLDEIDHLSRVLTASMMSYRHGPDGT